MAMREELKKLGYGSRAADEGCYDPSVPAQAFLAGYAAAVKEAEPLVQRLKVRLRHFPLDPDSQVALTTYLTAIGDETPTARKNLIRRVMTTLGAKLMRRVPRLTQAAHPPL
jgi:hypothetical protein